MAAGEVLYGLLRLESYHTPAFNAHRIDDITRTLFQ